MLEDIGIATPEDIVVSHPRTGVAVAAFKGEHDVHTKDEVAALLGDLIAKNQLVIAALGDALFIDSSFLSNLVQADTAAKGRGTRLVLEMGTDSIVHKVFEVSGLLERLDCITSKEQALAQLETHRPAH